MGATGLSFNYPFGASEVTRHGREILNKSIAWAEGLGYKIVNADTDSIAFCKSDFAEFTEDERKQRLTELNKLYPDMIHWEDDGYYKTIIVVKAKNVLS